MGLFVFILILSYSATSFGNEGKVADVAIEYFGPKKDALSELRIFSAVVSNNPTSGFMVTVRNDYGDTVALTKRPTSWSKILMTADGKEIGEENAIIDSWPMMADHVVLVSSKSKKGGVSTTGSWKVGGIEEYPSGTESIILSLDLGALVGGDIGYVTFRVTVKWHSHSE